jgi:hypothetical protein
MRRLYLWLLLVACLLSVLFLRIYPLTIIQPFKSQTEGPLLRALLLLRIAPAVSTLIGVLALVAVIFSWKNLRLWSRIGVSVMAVLICGFAALTRVNVFEAMMFHSAGTPQFVSVEKAKIAPDDMLITVAINGDAHAYPILEMGYHHISNDFVGGVPVVATY